MKRILVYSHDTFGLGNIRRMLEISRHLVASDPDISVLIVSGSPMLHAFRVPERIDYIKLPCLRRTVKGDYDVKSLDMDYDALIRLRANLLVSTVLDFEPDLVLVDKKPFGVGNELAPAFELLRRRQRQPRTVLLLRDILDSAEATTTVWRKNGYYDAVLTHYDEVLVVGSREVFDLPAEYDFPPAVAERVRFCGYLQRPRSLTPRVEIRARHGIPAQERLLLLTVGGGEDGYRLLSTYMTGAALSASPHRALIVCGPEMRAEQRRQLRTQAARHTHIIIDDFSDDMMGLMDAADLVLCMGGYNTVCELLTLRKRALLVPRTRPVQEQWIRAQRLQSLGLFRALHPDRLTPEQLTEAIDTEFERGNVRSHQLYQIDLDGLSRISTHIAAQLGQSSALSPLRRLTHWTPS